MHEIEVLRTRFGRFLLALLWLHVPVNALVAVAAGQSWIVAALVSVLLAGAYHLMWWRRGTALATRYVSAVALMGEPALLVYLLMGHPWQMDMHMYFFAVLALTIAWWDWRVIVMASAAVAAHHLVFDLAMPMALFPSNSDLPRVGLHALIVAFQAAVLVWLSRLQVASFERIGAMSAEIISYNETLERKVEERTREAESANRAKSLFLANMSHEIRTPMNAIIGFCHLTLRSELAPKQRDYVSKIRNASRSLLDLINDILDFSKIEAGKLTLEQTHFDLRASLENPVAIASVKAAEKNVTVRLLIDPSVPSTLLGDSLRLNQVVLNLLSNAIKFTEIGTVTVGIRLVTLAEPAVTLEIMVRDSGIGMSEEQLSRLFSSFSQADSSTTRRFGGTGLGLAISKQIVELMGGRIHVESTPGTGSTFTFTATLQLGDPRQLPQMMPPEELRSLHVLVADDNQASREILEDVFTSWGMRVDLVASGREVLSAIETASQDGRRYDLLLMDWKMPGMTGIETVEVLQARYPAPARPKVLMISAYEMDDEKPGAMAMGVSGFLVKPVSPSHLQEAITSIFRPTGEVAVQGAETVPMVAPNLRGLRVLVAEDNEINRQVAMELLTDAGLVVEVAENGRIACELVLASGQHYDAVLMDVQMPEMDGIAATKLIREAFSKAQLPIIAMTAHAYEAERQRCLDAGMDDHVAKPVDPALLVRTLDRWLKPVAAPSAPVPAAAPKPVAAAGELPDSLPPFDIPAALIRLNGKRPLLRKLIGDFGTSFADTMAKLQGQIAADALDDARRLAHTLKGVAGALEARDLYEAAAHMEDAIAHGSVGTFSLHLQQLETALIPALTAAQGLTRVAAPPVAVTEAVNYAAFIPLIDELRQLLQRRSLRARKAFELLEQQVGAHHQDAGLTAVKAALDRLDFDAAARALDGATEGQSQSRLVEFSG